MRTTAINNNTRLTPSLRAPACRAMCRPRSRPSSQRVSWLVDMRLDGGAIWIDAAPVLPSNRSRSEGPSTDLIGKLGMLLQIASPSNNLLDDLRTAFGRVRGGSTNQGQGAQELMAEVRSQLP